MMSNLKTIRIILNKDNHSLHLKIIINIVNLF